MKPIPLNDFEMFELLQAAYPEKFKDESDATWDAAQEFAETLSGWHAIADLLGRVAFLTMPVKSELSGRYFHRLGKVKIKNGVAEMSSVVKRSID